MPFLIVLSRQLPPPLSSAVIIVVASGCTPVILASSVKMQNPTLSSKPEKKHKKGKDGVSSIAAASPPHQAKPAPVPFCIHFIRTP